MNAEDWAIVGVFVWLGAYILFFLGACLLYKRDRSTARLLLMIGTALLVTVNLALLAEYWEITNIQYNPIYEDTGHYGGFYVDDIFPAWQRWYYWGVVVIDIIGKTLAGISLIMESRQLINKRRMTEYYNNLPTPSNP